MIILKNQTMKFFKFSLLFILGVFLITACDPDEPTPVPQGENPISSFQFEVAADDFLKVVFSNFSQNATSYRWDFGDGNTSTEEAPTHTYAGGGDYEVVLEAINGSESRESSKTISITDPNTEVTKITGASSKVWKLSRSTDETDAEYACIVGPENRSEIWWALGLVSPYGDRPCFMEEEYIFGADGSFTYDPKGMVWADAGIWAPSIEAQCVDSTDPANMVGVSGDDLSAWGAGEFTFEFDAANSTLTLIGTGAHVGIPKVGTNDEFSTPQPQVTYKIVKLETDGPIDKMSLETTIPAPGYWQFNLVSYDNPADEPSLEEVGPAAAFDFSIDQSIVSFTNFSSNADSYLWDFGDGNTSTEESPTHTYSVDGSYTVRLTATSNIGTDETTRTVIVSANSVFDETSLSGADNKIWKLNPDAAALAVGPAIGSGEFWSSSVDDITVRDCTFDDEYIFGTAGDFTYDAKGDVWAEGYMGVDPAGCISEGDLSSDAAAWGSGEHAYEVTVGASATDPSFVTVIGTGAFIGLPKAFNGGEYAMGPPETDGSIRYQVLSYVSGQDRDVIQLAVDISELEDETLWWTFTLFSEN